MRLHLEAPSDDDGDGQGLNKFSSPGVGHISVLTLFIPKYCIDTLMDRDINGRRPNLKSFY